MQVLEIARPERAGGEDLHRHRAQGGRAGDLARGQGAEEHGDTEVAGRIRDLLVDVRRHQEPSPGVHRVAGLRRGAHRAHAEVRVLDAGGPLEVAEHAGRGEGQLDGADSARGERAAQRRGVGQFGGPHDGEGPVGGQRLEQAGVFVHGHRTPSSVSRSAPPASAPVGSPSSRAAVPRTKTCVNPAAGVRGAS